MTSFEIFHHPDSFELLRGAGTGEFDVVVTDPPYDAHCQGNQSSGTMMKELLTGKRKGGIPKITLPFDPVTDYAYTRDLVRIAKRWVVHFNTIEAFGAIRAANGTEYTGGQYDGDYVRGCLMIKKNAMGQLTGDRPASAYEGIALLHRRDLKKRWNGKGGYGVWVCNGTRGEGKATKARPNPMPRHPNQKPLALCLKLVALFTEPGETVLDPFCGSGRIGEACMLLGRNYVGVDNDPQCVENAKARCSAVTETWTDEDALKLCAMKELWEDEAT